MIISRLGGITSDNDSSLPQGEKIEVLFEADAAISVGMVVSHHTGSSTGTLVVPTVANASNDHSFVGIYEGKGGSGAATTTSGMSGNDAVDGDVILVTAYGKALGLGIGSGTAWVDGNPVTPSLASAGQIIGVAVHDVGLTSPLIALEAYSGGAAAKALFVKCM